MRVERSSQFLCRKNWIVVTCDMQPKPLFPNSSYAQITTPQTQNLEEQSHADSQTNHRKNNFRERRRAKNMGGCGQSRLLPSKRMRVDIFHDVSERTIIIELIWFQNFQNLYFRRFIQKAWFFTYLSSHHLPPARARHSAAWHVRVQNSTF